MRLIEWDADLKDQEDVRWQCGCVWSWWWWWWAMVKGVTLATLVMMPQSTRILTTACPKPAVPLEDCQREYGRVTHSASPQRSRYTEPTSFPPSCMVQRPGFSIESRSGYFSGFTNAAWTPSFASNGKTTCRTKKSSREPACPAKSPSCFRCSCAGLATSHE